MAFTSWAWAFIWLGEGYPPIVIDKGMLSGHQGQGDLLPLHFNLLPIKAILF